MKKSLLVFVASLMLATSNVIAEDDFNGVKAGDAVIFNGGQPHRLIESWYYNDCQVLTIEFQSTDFEPYTLTVESMYTTQQYYVTTPFVYLPIYVTGITVDLELETDGGDLYWGSFEATAAGSME